MIENPRHLIQTDEKTLFWYFNINQEQKWNTTKVFPSVTDMHQLELVKQQEQQLLIIAEPEDTVILYNTPSKDFIHYLGTQGIKVPKMILLNSSDSLQNLPLERSLFIPYINSEDIYINTSSFSELTVFGAEHQIVKSINNKFVTRKLAEENNFRVTYGFLCKNISELEQSFQLLCDYGFDQCVIKVPFGSSGKGLKIIENINSFNTLVKYIKRRSIEFELLIEGWYPNTRNINSQLWISKDAIRILAITEQKIDGNGVYLGTCFTPHFDMSLLTEYQREMLRLGQILKDKDFIGICGVDSIIDERGRLYPIIEINARFTQVTYLLPLIQRLILNYSHIYSQYIKYKSNQRLEFETILSIIKNAIQPDGTNKFLVYTFANYTLPDNSKTIYRLYVLIYGQEKDKVLDMLQRLQEL
ncbi:[Butirosin acyl-carrier protein]--L-glutamate ligase [Paenibacillus allorhizosphaerae]|uniref:[Butirosin acyl-carrier protein]--L-glutamate ligase n=1 Tax=Paenibacillus allorhizosphaerae TaxID=2849866 RepID=A0ABM8VUF0_9BACL|nr:ATP-grasp domain-containing protein [Paenibacillus allorhizosphaerae]CAG7658916.1 [Butirosin acyl-carrier protein]--L-glutamate ligase [Paenibacillus allorhizosphaerae]